MLIILVCLQGGLAYIAGGEQYRQFTPALEAWLNEHYPEPQANWQAWPLQVDEGAWLTAKAYRVLAVKDGERIKKIMRFVLGSEQGTSAPIVVTARVALLRKVMTANGLLQNGEAIIPADWHWEERAADSLPRDVILDQQGLNGKRLKKVMTRNEVFTRHAVEDIPTIGRGKFVILQVQCRNVQIRTDARSLEDGMQNAWIEVLPKGQDCKLKAQIVSPDLVQLVLNPE